MEANTRPLRAANGSFFVGKTAYSQGLRLCDFCDRRDYDCPEPNEEGCDQLVPALFFIPPHVGFEGRFSTFRPSAIWYDRAMALIDAEQPIALLEQGTHVRIGRARVLWAYQGPFWQMIKDHAHTNHLFLGKSKDEAPELLERWITNSMGSRYVKERDRICTVIDLERIP